MNKYLLLFVVAFVYVHADDSSSSEEDLKSLATLVQNKLNTTVISDFIVLSERTKKQCPDLEDKLDSTAKEVSTCLESIDLGEDTLCTLVRNNLERCAEPVKKLLVGCLPEESKGLPVLAIKVVRAVIDQACNSTVEEILELFNPCVAEKDFKSFDSCTKVKDALVEHKDKVPSKSLVCSLIPNLSSCVKSHREASCKNPVTKEALINFYEAIDKATATECADLNKTK